jgi:RND superfamily putative drug exporter
MLTKRGLCAAGAVVVAVLIAFTLVAALLGMWPNAVLSRRTRKGGPAAQPTDNGASRWARFVLRRPVAVLVACVAGLGVLALPAAHLEMAWGVGGAALQGRLLPALLALSAAGDSL